MTNDEGEMHKGKKAKRALYSMRDANGRFCKALSQSSSEGQVEKAPVIGVESVEKGEGGEAAIECYEFPHLAFRWYRHPKLIYSVKVKCYDNFTITSHLGR